MAANEQAVTVDEFCVERRISRSFFYKLLNEGKGPRLLKLGRATRITAEAAREFDLANEVKS
jgi:predicted DNA-binding transcriptional regulator AlpA